MLLLRFVTACPCSYIGDHPLSEDLPGRCSDQRCSQNHPSRTTLDQDPSRTNPLIGGDPKYRSTELDPIDAPNNTSLDKIEIWRKGFGSSTEPRQGSSTQSLAQEVSAPYPLYRVNSMMFTTLLSRPFARGMKGATIHDKHCPVLNLSMDWSNTWPTPQESTDIGTIASAAAGTITSAAAAIGSVRAYDVQRRLPTRW